MNSEWHEHDKNRDIIAERFAEFDAANPEVWELFKRFARQARDAGRGRYSADAILHRIRWHVAIETRSNDGFKINDHFSAMYARKLIAEDRTFAGFFETRVRKSA